MTYLRQLLAFALLAGCCGAALAASPAAAHYSFMDVYRLAVSAELAPGLQLPSAQASQFAGPAFAPAAAQFSAQFSDYQVRVASLGAQPAAPVFSVAAPGFAQAGFSFSSSAVPAPSRWLLILSGLALAAWVARRRLGYSL